MNHRGHDVHEGEAFEDLSNRVIGCAIEVHRILGPGLLESTYRRCLSRELELEKIEHACEVPVPVGYKGTLLECGYRIDILIEQFLILELKSVKEIDSVHEAQVLTYIKLFGARVGLIINFNKTQLRYGLKRFVL